MRLISTHWHLRLDEIYCSCAVKFESGNVSWRLTGKQLSGPLNGLHFPSTLSTAGSNHEGIKITCGRIVSSKQQLRDPLHSSQNESLKMHLCHEDSFSFSALIDNELFSWQVGLAAPLVCCWMMCFWVFFVIVKNSWGIWASQWATQSWMKTKYLIRTWKPVRKSAASQSEQDKGRILYLLLLV